MKVLQLAAILCCLVANVLVAPVEEQSSIIALDDETPVNYRLATDILPSKYDLTLKPYLSEEDDGDKVFTFDGTVVITLRATPANLREIVLHAKNLTILTRTLAETINPTRVIEITSTTLDDVTDKYTLILATPLTQNLDYTLTFTFVGLMGDDMHGFYKSYYVDEAGQQKWLGSTQFQTHHARRAFPCFDEPKFKAVFSVKINRPRGLSTRSNTRLSRSELIGDRYLDTYVDTPKMSTYILAFIVSDFVVRVDRDDKFSVIARPEFYSQTLYAHQVGPQLLQGFDNFTNLPYYTIGNDKMAMAAIPDFSAGAMENWGLLTYRERALLYQENSTTLSAQQSIAGVITHEQAHMWFGDLVTCDWWGYTWLNEGFARYFQYFMTNDVLPEFEMDKQFPIDQIQSVMVMDSTNTTNPMSNTATHSPTDLGRMFNSISYNKGGTIIRMMSHAMGMENFKTSLQNYLNEFKYTNTIPSHLFKHWKANWPASSGLSAADLDVLFADWTEQVGYPVLDVNITADGGTLEVKQNRFLLKEDDGSNPNLTYTVPFTFTTDLAANFNNTTPSSYLRKADATNGTRILLNASTKWVVANIQQTGYYRVNYDEKLWHQIHHALNAANWSGIHELNRAQIVDDLLTFGRSGLLKYDMVLSILEYLQTELNYLPWSSAFSGFSTLSIRLGTDQEEFGRFILSIVDKVYSTLGFEQKTGESTLDIYNRNKVISWTCKYGNKDCITKAQDYFKKLVDNGAPIPVNIRNAVYCTAMRQGAAKDFDVLYSKYLHETVATEQTLLISVLGCVKEPSLVERYFDIIISDSIRRQDKSSALSSLYSENPENVSPVFDLVTKKTDELAESMGDYAAVATVISNIASRFTTESQKESLEKFNAENKAKFGSSAATLERAVSTVEENLKWSEDKLPTFMKYLIERGSGAVANSISVVLVTIVAICTYSMGH